MKARVTLVVLILLTLPTILPFFNSRFFYTQDYIFIARLHQMSKALNDGQWPVRWAPDLRYGEPIFNFYAPLPYYIGAIIHQIGFDFIWTSKILFILASLLSVFSMYILGKYLFGKRAGIFAAVLYTYAPYRAVDMYVRGSLSEAWAFIFFPLIFYTSLRVAESANFKNLVFLGLSLAGLFLTHNVTTLMFLPFLLIWWIYLIVRRNKWQIVLPLFLSSILGFGLAAFFLLPAIFEKDFIQTKYLIVGYFNFRAHFVAYKQFFSTFWGYGSSLWGPNDGLSFQVGLVNWIILACCTIAAIFSRKDKKFLILLSILGASLILSLFLQHNKSAFVWEAIPLMAFIQFPWRFLGISIFIISLAGAALVPFLKDKLIILYFILIFTAIVSTISYFRPKDYVDDSFFDKFMDTKSMHQGADLTKDYLPIWVQSEGERFDSPRAEKGEIKILNIKQKSTALFFSADVVSESIVELPIAYFPGWQVKANNQIIHQSLPSKMGLIRFELPKGSYQIEARFQDTPIRTAGNIITLFSLLSVFILLKWPSRQKVYK